MLILISKEYDIYIPEIYGINTWGDGYHQESMEQNKDGKWIVHNWWYGGEWEEDITSEYEIEIIAEFNSIAKAKKFLIENNHKGKVIQLDILVDMYKNYKKWASKKCEKQKKTSVQKQKK